MAGLAGWLECFTLLNGRWLGRTPPPPPPPPPAQENYQEAIEVYQEALEFSPENAEILTTIGLLYLRLGENYRCVVPDCNSGHQLALAGWSWCR